MLDELSGRGDIEAVALLHQDLEILDSSFIEKLRERLRDPDVALVGNAGGRRVKSIAWWEGEVLGSWRWAFSDDGEQQYEPTEWENFVPDSRHGCHEVDALDGMLQVLSPWAVREMRYDPKVNAGGVHGCDIDLCFQARAAGKKVVVEELGTVHHQGRLVLGEDTETWIEAHVRFARKWAPMLGGAEDQTENWEARALRAEAEAAAARVQRGELSLMRNDSDRRLMATLETASSLRTEADTLRRTLRHEIEVREAELDSMKTSRSWRLTRPLRWAGNLARR